MFVLLDFHPNIACSFVVLRCWRQHMRHTSCCHIAYHRHLIFVWMFQSVTSNSAARCDSFCNGCHLRWWSHRHLYRARHCRGYDWIMPFILWCYRPLDSVDWMMTHLLAICVRRRCWQACRRRRGVMASSCRVTSRLSRCWRLDYTGRWQVLLHVNQPV